MGLIVGTDEELNELGYCVPVFRAIEAAGGPKAVAEAFGYKSRECVYRWFRPGWSVPIPAHFIQKLCRMGRNKVKEKDILKALEERLAKKAA